MTATIQVPVFTETRVFDFVKDRGKWYVELPEYDGSRDDLRMVAGADTWLDRLFNQSESVTMRTGAAEILDNRIEKLFDVPVFGDTYYIAWKLNISVSHHHLL